MNLPTLLVVSAVVGLLAPADGAAQKLALQIDGGLVTLDAEDVTVEEVLTRWSKATGMSIISKNGVGAELRISLRLEQVAEREALAAVLRDLSGYIMGERLDPSNGAVTIDRLMILPQSAAARTGANDPPVAAPAHVDEIPRELAPVPAPGEIWPSAF